MCGGAPQFTLISGEIEREEGKMHPELNRALSSARTAEIQQLVERSARTADVSADARRGNASRFSFRRYFGHAREAHKQPSRGTGRRAGGTGARVA
jgi:hypothetical protein